VIKRVAFIGCMLLLCASVGAKEKVKTVIRSWQLPQPTYIADTMAVKNNYLNYPLSTYVNDYSISNTWNGSLVSPIQSRLYFDRSRTMDDLFGMGYRPYIITAQDVHFYNTTVPYSNLGYKRDFTRYQGENEINFMFTGNINKRINLGMEINYLKAMGHYLYQENKLLNGSVFGSYNGNHYTFQAAFSWATLSNFENGGVQNVEDLNGPLGTTDIPVNLEAMSGYRYLSGFINHYYSITKERMINDTDIVYVPVTTFAHTFETNNSERRYIEQDASQDFYEHNYRSDLTTHDSTALLTIRNTLTVTFEEEFNTKLKFGANVYAMNECQRYLFHTGVSGDTLDYTWVNNTFVGGSLYKKRGKNLHYGFNGDVCVVGYKIGDFQVNANLEGIFRLGKDTMRITALVFLKNEEPSYYLRHYSTNHFQWENDFAKTMRFQAGGSVAYPTTWVKPSVDVRFENITKPIYFDQKGLAQQLDGNVQVIAANIHCDITTPWVNLENNVVWQHSSSDVLPLPDITLYHNLYYHGVWFKALDAQFGVDLRYHTKYYSPVLNPSTGQFCLQNEVQIGNYPEMNLYCNFFVRAIHLKFFFQYAHFNRLFMKDNTQALVMPNYPYNPGLFRAGIAWTFYR